MQLIRQAGSETSFQEWENMPDLGTILRKICIILKLNILNIVKKVMVKTLRIEDEEIHKDLLRIQGKIQAESGEAIKLELILQELIDCYNNKNRSRKK